MSLDALLAQLEAAGLVRRLDELEPVFVFKHSLTLESAYQSLLNRTRREIHLQVASTYEVLYSRQLDEYAPLLAYHYAEGGDEDKALVYETLAGDVSMRVFANAEALDHYSRALDIAKRLTPNNSGLLQDLFLKRGRVYELNGDYDRVLENYDEMLTVARERGDKSLELQSMLATATVLSVPSSKYNPKLAEELSSRALTIAREIGDRGAQAHILRNLMLIARWIKDPMDAVSFGEQSLAIARELGLRQEVAFTLNDLAVHGYLDAGQLLQALAAAKEASELWREQKNLPMLADSQSSSALANYALGNFDDVIAASDEALAISESIANLWGQSYARWVVGNVHSDRGDLEQAVRVMQDSIRIGAQAGFSGAEVGVRNLLAVAHAEYGMLDRGLEIAKQAAEIAQPRFSAWLPWSQSVLARLYARTGRLDEAEAAARQARNGPIEYHVGRVMGLISLQLTLTEAEVALARHDLSYALGGLDGQIDYFRQTRARALLPDLLFAKAQVARMHGKMELARDVLIEAAKIAESLSSRRTMWRIYVAMAAIEAANGNESEARSLRDRARQVIQYISGHTNNEQRRAFLNLPDVAAITQN